MTAIGRRRPGRLGSRPEERIHPREGSMKGRARTLAVVLAVVGISAAAVAGRLRPPTGARSKRAIAHAKPPGPTNCGLRHNVKHVVYLIFDNVHFLRDNPNVPSDLEQMPHLLNFIRGNGTLLDQRPHGADLAYRERDPDQPDRRLFRPARPGGLELVPLLQERRLDRVLVVVQVLDRPRRTTSTPAS